MITKLWLKDFRNLEETVVKFESQKTVFIVGDNNQGKTNFLESLYILGNGESPVGSPLPHVVRFDKQEAVLGVDFSAQDNDYRYYLKVNKYGQKVGVLNQKEIKTQARLRMLLHVAFLSADSIRIFQENADFRRKELDKFASACNEKYDTLKRNYNKVLKQKNTALKKQEGLETIPIWNKQLCQYGAEIVSIRLQCLNRIELKLKDCINTLLPSISPDVKLIYKYTRLNNITHDNYEDELAKQLELDKDKERYTGYTLVGPQRDDFDIEIDGKALYSFFSRGINRSMAIIFKVIQLMIIEESFNYFPVLLLDEPFAELDNEKKETLIPFITQKTQCIYTTIQQEDATLFQNSDVYRIKQGVLCKDG